MFHHVNAAHLELGADSLIVAGLGLLVSVKGKSPVGCFVFVAAVAVFGVVMAVLALMGH